MWEHYSQMKIKLKPAQKLPIYNLYLQISGRNCIRQSSYCKGVQEIHVFNWAYCLLAVLCLVTQSCLTLCDPTDCGPPGSSVHWDSPGKNPGVGCHFLLQCMKVKSQSEVAQSCPTPSDPMDCSLPGSSVHGIFQAKYWSVVPLPSLSTAVIPT